MHQRLLLSLPRGLKRDEIRRHVIGCFLSEDPGTGKGEKCSQYIYEVERLNGRSIVLKRPAFLNKGVDFTVHVEGVQFRTRGPSRDMPSHSDIVNDLKAKQAHSPERYPLIQRLIIALYDCRDVDLQTCEEGSIQAGLLSTPEVLMAIKWLFIEQDVTYWNWSGRAMLLGGLRGEGLA